MFTKRALTGLQKHFVSARLLRVCVGLSDHFAGSATILHAIDSLYKTPKSST